MAVFVVVRGRFSPAGRRPWLFVVRPSPIVVSGSGGVEEVVALIVGDDEGREVLNCDPPDGLHPEVFHVEDFDVGDAVLGQTGRGPADGA